MSEEKNIYVARDASGKFTGCVFNNPEHKREVAKDIAGFIRRGDTVELMTRTEMLEIARPPLAETPQQDQQGFDLT